MATTKYGPAAGRTYSATSMLTSDAGASLTSAGVSGPSDQTTIIVANGTNGATATTFTVSEVQLDGNTRVITTLSGLTNAAVTVPTAVPGVNGTALELIMPGPLFPIVVTLAGTAPTGNIYIEIKETMYRSQ